MGTYITTPRATDPTEVRNVYGQPGYEAIGMDHFALPEDVTLAGWGMAPRRLRLPASRRGRFARAPGPDTHR